MLTNNSNSNEINTEKNFKVVEKTTDSSDDKKLTSANDINDSITKYVERLNLNSDNSLNKIDPAILGNSIIRMLNESHQYKRSQSNNKARKTNNYDSFEENLSIELNNSMSASKNYILKSKLIGEKVKDRDKNTHVHSYKDYIEYKDKDSVKDKDSMQSKNSFSYIQFNQNSNDISLEMQMNNVPPTKKETKSKFYKGTSKEECRENSFENKVFYDSDDKDSPDMQFELKSPFKDDFKVGNFDANNEILSKFNNFGKNDTDFNLNLNALNNLNNLNNSSFHNNSNRSIQSPKISEYNSNHNYYNIHRITGSEYGGDEKGEFNYDQFLKNSQNDKFDPKIFNSNNNSHARNSGSVTNNINNTARNVNIPGNNIPNSYVYTFYNNNQYFIGNVPENTQSNMNNNDRVNDNVNNINTISNNSSKQTLQINNEFENNLQDMRRLSLNEQKRLEKENIRMESFNRNKVENYLHGSIFDYNSKKKLSEQTQPNTKVSSQTKNEKDLNDVYLGNNDLTSAANLIYHNYTNSLNTLKESNNLVNINSNKRDVYNDNTANNLSSTSYLKYISKMNELIGRDHNNDLNNNLDNNFLHNDLLDDSTTNKDDLSLYKQNLNSLHTPLSLNNAKEYIPFYLKSNTNINSNNNDLNNNINNFNAQGQLTSLDANFKQLGLNNLTNINSNNQLNSNIISSQHIGDINSKLGLGSSQVINPIIVMNSSGQIIPHLLTNSSNVNESFVNNFNLALQYYKVNLNNLISISKEQLGCRKIQKLLEDHTHLGSSVLYPQMRKNLMEVIVDQFGNYLIQKLIECLTPEQIEDFVSLVTPEIKTLSNNQFGTRVLQKLIDYFDTIELRTKFLKAYNPENLLTIILNSQGNHVISKIISKYPPEELIPLYDTFKNNTEIITKDKHGCCVIQKMIEHSDPEFREILIRNLMCNVEKYILDPYANYVLQLGVTYNYKVYNNNILIYVKNNFTYYSLERFSCNVIEKTLSFSEENVRNQIIELIANDDVIIVKLLLDLYGNHILQKALIFAGDKDKEKILKVIGPQLNNLDPLPHGPKLKTRLLTNYSLLNNLYQSCNNSNSIQNTIGFNVGNNNNSNINFVNSGKVMCGVCFTAKDPKCKCKKGSKEVNQSNILQGNVNIMNMNNMNNLNNFQNYQGVNGIYPQNNNNNQFMVSNQGFQGLGGMDINEIQQVNSLKRQQNIQIPFNNYNSQTSYSNMNNTNNIPLQQIGNNNFINHNIGSNMMYGNFKNSNNEYQMKHFYDGNNSNSNIVNNMNNMNYNQVKNMNYSQVKNMNNINSMNNMNNMNIQNSNNMNNMNSINSMNQGNNHLSQFSELPIHSIQNMQRNQGIQNMYNMTGMSEFNNDNRNIRPLPFNNNLGFDMNNDNLQNLHMMNQYGNNYNNMNNIGMMTGNSIELSNNIDLQSQQNMQNMQYYNINSLNNNQSYSLNNLNNNTQNSQLNKTSNFNFIY